MVAQVLRDRRAKMDLPDQPVQRDQPEVPVQPEVLERQELKAPEDQQDQPERQETPEVVEPTAQQDQLGPQETPGAAEPTVPLEVPVLQERRVIRVQTVPPDHLEPPEVPEMLG